MKDVQTWVDEATSVGDSELKALDAYFNAHNVTGRIVGRPKMFASPAIKSQGVVWAKAFAEAVTSGIGVIEIDSFSQLEGRAIRMQRGSGKSSLNQFLWQGWDDMFTHTVKHDLKQLQYAQTRTTKDSSDPLFEAMEIHNERIRLGKKAIKEMFHAKPLNLNQQPTNGPIKAKDWE